MRNQFFQDAEAFASDEQRDEMPNAMDIEYGVIGSAFANNRLMEDLGFLQPDHFYSQIHASIYAAMLGLHAAKQVITPFTVAPYLPGTANMVKYLTNAVSAAISIFQPAKEARVIVEMAARRQLIKTCQDISAGMLMENASSAESIIAATSAFEKIMSQAHHDKFQDDRQVTHAIIARMKNPSKFYSTGLRKLDQAMGGGIIPGKNYAFLARKKMGKTSLAATISCNLNQQKIKHLFICAEMNAVEIHERVIARLTHSYTSTFRNDYGRGPVFQKKLEEQIELSNGCTIYQSAPGIKFDDLRSSVAQAISIYGIKLVILDSLQLVGGKASRKSTSEHQDEVSQWLSDYGREREVSTVVMGQINQTGGVRGGEGVLLACDQAYELQAPEDDPSRSDRWFEMRETRYAARTNVGDKNTPGVLMHENGQYFYEPDYSNGTQNLDL